MEDNLIELLETFGYKVRRQGSFLEDEAYPDTFITFWNASESEAAAYDNATKRVAYLYNVNVYSDDPDVTFSLLRDIRKLLKKKWLHHHHAGAGCHKRRTKPHRARTGCGHNSR